MIKSFDASFMGRILGLLAGAALILLLGIAMFAPVSEGFAWLSPVGSAWAGGPVCDADGDGWVIDHRKCSGAIDCDDTNANLTDNCSGSSSPGTVFHAMFTGAAVSGSGYSNPTENTGNVANLVFNKLASEVVFTIAVGSSCDGTYGGNPDRLEATMQLYDGLSINADMVARLYFQFGGYKYKIELFEAAGSAYGWDGGDFPPFAGGEITRSAGSWLIGKSGGPAGPCVGDGGTFSSPVDFTLSAQ